MKIYQAMGIQSSGFEKIRVWGLLCLEGMKDEFEFKMAVKKGARRKKGFGFWFEGADMQNPGLKF